MSLRSPASCSILLIFRNGLSPFFCFPHHFIGQPSFIHDRKCLAASRAFQSRNSFTKKGPRGYRRRSKSREETPWGAATAGSYRLSGFANQKDPRIDEAQFLLTLLALALQISHRRRVGPCCCRSRRLRIMPLGLTNTLAPLFQLECFSNKPALCFRLRFSSYGGYPKIEYDGCAVGDFDPAQGPLVSHPALLFSTEHTTVRSSEMTPSAGQAETRLNSPVRRPAPAQQLSPPSRVPACERVPLARCNRTSLDIA